MKELYITSGACEADHVLYCVSQIACLPLRLSLSWCALALWVSSYLNTNSTPQIGARSLPAWD